MKYVNVNGENRALFTFDDCLKVVEEFCGSDLVQAMESIMLEEESQSGTTQAAMEQEMLNYEASLESNTTAFRDISKICEKLLKSVKNSKVLDQVSEIYKIAINQY